MKISSIELTEPRDGLTPFRVPSLGDVVVLTGSNGSGKTRLLKLLENYIHTIQHGKEESFLKLHICQA